MKRVMDLRKQAASARGATSEGNRPEENAQNDSDSSDEELPQGFDPYKTPIWCECSKCCSLQQVPQYLSQQHIRDWERWQDKVGEGQSSQPAMPALEVMSRHKQAQLLRALRSEHGLDSAPIKPEEDSHDRGHHENIDTREDFGDEDDPMHDLLEEQEALEEFCNMYHPLQFEVGHGNEEEQGNVEATTIDNDDSRGRSSNDRTWSKHTRNWEDIAFNASTPLFSGSTISVLSFTLLLLDLQALYRASNVFMTKLFMLLHQKILPKNNAAPPS